MQAQNVIKAKSSATRSHFGNLVAVLFFVTVSPGCNLDKTEVSQDKQVQVQYGTQDLVGNDTRKTVVIYYANETNVAVPESDLTSEEDRSSKKLIDTVYKDRSPNASENFKAFASLMDDGIKSEDKTLFSSDDRSNFAETKLKMARAALKFDIDNIADLDNLTRFICDGLKPLAARTGGPIAGSIGGLAIFTNYQVSNVIAGAPNGTRNFSFCEAGNTLKKATFNADGRPLGLPSDFATGQGDLTKVPYVSQPLSHPLTLANALDAVRSRFPPDRFTYVLITKSHGNDLVAIAPLMPVDIRHLSPAAKFGMLQTMSAEKKARDAKSQSPAESAPLHKNINPAIKAGLDKDIADSLGENDPTKEFGTNEEGPGGRYQSTETKYGIDKGRYLTILKSAIDMQMQFDVVFLASCRSQLSSKNGLEAITSTRGVNAIITSDKDGMKYNAMNGYETIVKKVIERAKNGSAEATGSGFAKELISYVSSLPKN